MLDDADGENRSEIVAGPGSDVEPVDGFLVATLAERDTVFDVRLRDGRTLHVVNIAWGYDESESYAHVTTNVSPGVVGASIDTFSTCEVEFVRVPDGGVVYDGFDDADAVTEWFRLVGYSVSVEADGRVAWASLRSLRNPEFVVRQYGSGPDARAAVCSAVSRWRTEQIG